MQTVQDTLQQALETAKRDLKLFKAAEQVLNSWSENKRIKRTDLLGNTLFLLPDLLFSCGKLRITAKQCKTWLEYSTDNVEEVKALRKALLLIEKSNTVDNRANEILRDCIDEHLNFNLLNKNMKP